MTVRVYKTEENVAEKLRKLDKPSGVAGEAILRADTTREQQNIKRLSWTYQYSDILQPSWRINSLPKPLTYRGWEQ